MNFARKMLVQRAALLASCAVVALGSAAQAQSTAAPEGQAKAEEATVETVVVTGFRASLNKALDAKQEQVGAIDMIVAEDIADFPDLNLAESLQRVPGVVIARDAGEGRQISVRGLGPQFTRVRINGIEAMSSVTDRSRDLLIRSGRHEPDKVLVSVQDSGIGLKAESLDHLFEAFFTTKPKGMGMGLAISRSIIEAHGGLLWAVPNEGPGATFQFTLLK